MGEVSEKSLEMGAVFRGQVEERLQRRKRENRIAGDVVGTMSRRRGRSGRRDHRVHGNLIAVGKGQDSPAK